MSREFVSSVSGEEFISQLFSNKDGKDDTHPVKMELWYEGLRRLDSIVGLHGMKAFGVESISSRSNFRE